MTTDTSDDMDDSCPRCGCCSTDWHECHECGGEGEVELYNLDPLWYAPDDTEVCEWCQGKGGWSACLGGCDAEGRHVRKEVPV